MSIKSIISRESAVNFIFFVVSASLFVVAANVATAEPHRGGGGDRHIQRMADELNLSDTQRQQFKQIHRAARGEKLAIRDAMQDNREALHKLDPSASDYSSQVERLAEEKGDLVKRMIIQRSQVRAQMHAILTPEQRELAKDMKKHRPKFGQGHRQRGEQRCGRR